MKGRKLAQGVRSAVSCAVRVVMLNSELGGQWREEERGRTFPFHHEKPFELLVVTTPLHYAVLGNGELIAEVRLCSMAGRLAVVVAVAVGALGFTCAQYKHRAQPATIRYVNVEGEVQVTGVYEASGVRLKKRGYKLALSTNPLQWVSNDRTSVLASTYYRTQTHI